MFGTTTLTLAALEYAQIVSMSSGGSSDSSSFYLLLLGPAAGIAFYTSVYLRYRNTDKRYEYEHKTASEVDGVQGYDNPSGRVRGVENSRIRGDNSKKPRERLGQATSINLHG